MSVNVDAARAFYKSVAHMLSREMDKQGARVSVRLSGSGASKASADLLARLLQTFLSTSKRWSWTRCSSKIRSASSAPFGT